MTTARPIPTKVSRLIPMLGSPADHEALSAARAIGRVLDREGLGFTDLAAAIPTTAIPVPTGQPAPFRFREAPAATVPEFHAYRWRRAFTPRQEEQHRARVRFCRSRPWCLSAWERGFIESVARLHGNLSIAQGDKLAAITDRLDAEVRRAC